MMDLSSLTFAELNKLYFLLGVEYLRRYWWAMIIAFVVIMVGVSIAEKFGRN